MPRKEGRLSMLLPPLAGALVVAFVTLLGSACDGGAGGSLDACPASSDIVPGGACAMGTACPSAASLPDCPGSAGSLTCNCTKDGWLCADPTGSVCQPDAADLADGPPAPDASDAADTPDANVAD